MPKTTRFRFSASALERLSCPDGTKAVEVSDADGVLGHTQLKTSQRYSHLSNETLLSAVDAAAGATGSDWGVAQRNWGQTTIIA